MWSLAWWWMLLFAPLPALVRRRLRPQVLDNDAALRVPAPGEFARLSAGRAIDGRSARLWLLWAIWLLAVFAAARPQFVGEALSLPVSGRDLLMAVDLSGSMEEQDFELEGNYVDRLTATKAVADDFIDRRVGDRIGLILFGREAYLQTPLTFDRQTVRTLLAESAIFGRRSMGESVESGSFHDRWRVWHDGQMLHAEDFRLDGAVAKKLRDGAVADGQCAIASILYVAANAEDFVKPCREMLGESGGASFWNGKLLVRLLARNGYELRETLVPLLRILAAARALPKTWTN